MRNISHISTRGFSLIEMLLARPLPVPIAVREASKLSTSCN
ncbi:prepilin-type N-terminal cleavage/methylation domain-containing protein [Salmonella enterica subsp. enterica serovar Typhimurium]|uniref:Prepilin-type N-terminal cleavage/methylation domain-containing protein n=3 Tax=Salmonella enterica I TaxID=59201 RepID=A0A603NAV4_SALET|nr:prepilin-type N-terminal cleavage/methylation domain-containing protein [Salmonella enterica]EAY2854536.1 prepilin-type N-terminal cleavage/methylation domain-containing protein [Salmonella enterica subsp. enterica serovar Typhimurium]EBP3820867.1 prepilin-type N-terminal cleavage/methylation domain-containing protein [Salmonella enterica subsp. enterica]ECA6542856.1 prepilin-type N-terminal cleavage/methylation domain-containing protein [Salmonella enterica subsp. enterica serovar Saintpaul]